MSDQEDLHVVIGASGGTGSAIVGELHRSGRRIRAVNRSGRMTVPSGVETVAADAVDADRIREACAGAAVVYNCVNPPFQQWRGLFPAAVDGVLAGAAAAGAVHVFADDTWMYGRVTGPMTEHLPHRPVSGRGVLRAWLAEKVLAAHHRGKVRTVIGRAGELYGPRVESVFGANIFGAALRGRTARWIGRLDVPVTPLFIEDFARGLITLGESPDAHGEAWHILHADALTGREFTRQVFDAAGTRHRVTAHGTATARTLGLFSSLAREGAEMVYQFEAPFVVDGSRFARRFGAKPTPHDEAIRRTLDWYRSDPGPSRRLGR